MKRISQLYRDNIFVTVICDAIALFVCATTAIFTITIVTMAFIF
ncbi:MAG TPA: hypothetical protein VFQ73_00710 [Flavisolibacter sp.]|nr:hypothetical protein [Flavisolibacter sp.]